MSFSIDIGYDIDFDKYKETQLAYHQTMLDKVNCLAYFPNNCRIDVEENKENIMESYRQIFPKELAYFYQQRLEELIWKTS